MGKVKNILTSLEKNKSKLAKFLIICAAIKFFTSTLYRVYSITDSRTLLETTINIYSMLIIGCIFLHEFIKCFLCTSLIQNMKLITHYQGQGTAFILVSFIYMSRSLDNQQNYSAYLLFFVGIILIAINCKFVSDEQKSPLVNSPGFIASVKQGQNVEIFNMNMQTHSTQGNSDRENEYKIEVPEKVVSVNPYDLPEDF